MAIEVTRWLMNLGLPCLEKDHQWTFAIPTKDLSPGVVNRDKGFLSITVLAKRAPVPDDLLRRAIASHGCMQLGKFCLDSAGNLWCSVSVFADTLKEESFKAALMRVAAMVHWAQSGGPDLQRILR